MTASSSPTGGLDRTAPGDEVDEVAKHQLDRALQRLWHPVAVAADVDRGPVAARLFGRSLVVARLGGAVAVLDDVCPHRGAALHLGAVVDGCLRCPYHGWRFDGDGACTEVPALPPGRSIPSSAGTTAFPAVERSGLVWTCLDADPLLPCPDLPLLGAVDEVATIVGDPYVWSCHASRRMENFLDFAHFAFVHDGTLGSSSAPQVPPYDVWRDETGLRATQTRTEPPNTGVKTTEGDGSSSITTFVDYLCPTPLCGRLDQHLSGGRRFALTVISSPTAADVCTNFWMLERNYDVDGPDAPYLDFQKRVNEEDRVVIESLVPDFVSPDRRDEVHVATVDRMAVHYRRWLDELVRSSAPTRLSRSRR